MWKKYKKTKLQEMRPYVPGEDLIPVSVAPGETPKAGGMIARDEYGSFWYVTPEFFEENYAPCTDDLSAGDKFEAHIKGHSEKAFSESHEKYQAIFEQAADSIVIVDIKTGGFIEFNEKAHKNLGYTAEEFKKLAISDFEVMESAEEVKKHIRKIVETGEDCFETKHRTKTGEIRDISVNSRLIKTNNHSFIQSVWRDVTEQKQLEKKLRNYSYFDELTGVANRRQFDRIINTEWERSFREAKPLSLVMVDIDFFKLYNDTYGHVCGDDCLQKVAQALHNTIMRPADVVSRYGGEEFAVILPFTDATGGFTVAEKFRKNVEAMAIPHQASTFSGYLTISSGVAAVTPDSATSPSTLILAADAALYKAKKEGRNRVVMAEDLG